MATTVIVAEATTYDNARLLFYEDGMITTGLGYGLGRGTGAGRTEQGIKIAVEANRLVVGEVGLYDLSEVQTLSEVARKYVEDCCNSQSSPLPGKFRQRVAKKLRP